MNIPETEFSEEFVTAMKRRAAVSFFKYGPVAEAVAAHADFLAALRTRLRRYEETGNTEWLIDAANYAMFEFLYPSAHFRATDAEESPGQAPERRRRRTGSAEP